MTDLLEVISSGPLATIQDAGRPDFTDIGVPHGGACDPLCHVIANALVACPPEAPVIEIAGGGFRARALEACIVAVAGVNVHLAVTGRAAMRANRGVYLHRGDVLEVVVNPHSGLRSYMAIQGGFQVAQVLGSASAYPLAGFPGLAGRSLESGDRLSAKPGRSAYLPPLSWPDSGPQPQLPDSPLHVLTAPTKSYFSSAALRSFAADEFKVTEHADRTGIRLTGGNLRPSFELGEPVSYGMVRGAVQVSNDGTLMLLMPDHPTIGGYPVIGVLTSVDIPMAAQLRPGDSVRFSPMPLAESQRLLTERDSELRNAIAELGREDYQWSELLEDAGMPGM